MRIRPWRSVSIRCGKRASSGSASSSRQRLRFKGSLPLGGMELNRQRHDRLPMLLKGLRQVGDRARVISPYFGAIQISKRYLGPLRRLWGHCTKRNQQ